MQNGPLIYAELDNFEYGDNFLLLNFQSKTLSVTF